MASARRNKLRVENGPCNKYIKDGKCRLVPCTFSHTTNNTYKTVPCPDPECPQRHDCSYLHEGKDERQSPPVHADKLYRTKMCEYVIKGEDFWKVGVGKCGHAHYKCS